MTDMKATTATTRGGSSAAAAANSPPPQPTHRKTNLAAKLLKLLPREALAKAPR